MATSPTVNVGSNPASWSGQDWASLILGQQHNNSNIQNLFLGGGLDPNGRYEGYNAAKYLMPAEFYNLANQYGYYNSLQPMAQQATSSLLNQLSNPNSMSAQYRNQAMAAGQSTLQNVLQRLRSGGAGVGATQGAQLNALNQANMAGNRYQAQMDSPQGRAQRLNSILGVISGQQPNLSRLSELHGIETGTPRNASFGDMVMSLAPAAASFFSHGMGGGGAGGGGGMGGDPNMGLWWDTGEEG